MNEFVSNILCCLLMQVLVIGYTFSRIDADVGPTQRIPDRFASIPRYTALYMVQRHRGKKWAREIVTTTDEYACGPAPRIGLIPGADLLWMRGLPIAHAFLFGVWNAWLDIVCVSYPVSHAAAGPWVILHSQRSQMQQHYIQNAAYLSDKKAPPAVFSTTKDKRILLNSGTKMEEVAAFVGIHVPVVFAGAWADERYYSITLKLWLFCTAIFDLDTGPSDGRPTRSMADACRHLHNAAQLMERLFWRGLLPASIATYNLHVLTGHLLEWYERNGNPSQEAEYWIERANQSLKAMMLGRAQPSNAGPFLVNQLLVNAAVESLRPLPTYKSLHATLFPSPAVGASSAVGDTSGHKEVPPTTLTCVVLITAQPRQQQQLGEQGWLGARADASLTSWVETGSFAATDELRVSEYWGAVVRGQKYKCMAAELREKGRNEGDVHCAHVASRSAFR